jgi:HK97 family phage major capsid protein
MEDSLMFYGDAVKAMGEGKIGGYLVRYSTPKDPDLTDDFFDKDSDLGVEPGNNMPVYYQHGYDSHFKNRKIGKAKASYDEYGLWLEAQLEMRDEYERSIYERAEAGKMGWSSGAAGHLVEREQIGKAWHIKSWPIAEASLTPTPAEPRNNAFPIKSLFIDPSPAVVTEVEGNTNSQPVMEGIEMEKEELTALMAQVADEAVKKYALSIQPEVKAGYVQVVEDETDKAAKNMQPGDFFKAVRDAAFNPGGADKRLYALNAKASGLNEGVPSEGGFLVPQDVANTIHENMYGVGSLLSRFNAIPVTGNGMLFNGVDESSRANGSRGGGVTGYWMAEAASKTASKPKFNQIDLKLKKVAALCYATDELLDDAGALNGWINRYVPGELRFKVEDAIMNGDGIGKPSGILNANCLVSATRVDAHEIDATDIATMWASRYTGANDYVWTISSTIFPQLNALVLGQSPVYMPPGGMSQSPFGTIYGRPVIETEYNPALGLLGDIALIAPSEYALITKGSGVQAASSIHVSFLTDETVFRFVARYDGAPLWPAAVTRFQTSSDFGTTVSPFVALAAST